MERWTKIFSIVSSPICYEEIGLKIFRVFPLSFEKEVFDFYKVNNIPVPNYLHSLEYVDPVDHAKFVFEKEKYEKLNEKIDFNKIKTSYTSQSQT